ncbi:unnamed protein product [Darwinula stevensoni]|uniref:Uncharacterized protein n=1 Tax=Darwinula stevensoni TaxID=69355 RepID=A0A7R9AC00_9CRUS|nr:unnamed protein product [Darwinula stevensoni]CAG0899341.1 unnamed protein product [Darwinula stevensoni]
MKRSIASSKTGIDAVNKMNTRSRDETGVERRGREWEIFGSEHVGRRAVSLGSERSRSDSSHVVRWERAVGGEGGSRSVLVRRPANFVVFYLEEPDSTGHDNGPDSPEVKAMVERVDELLGYLVSRLDSLGLLERTNLIFLSDHGMLGVNRSMALHLDSIPVPPSDYWHATNSPLVLIYPLEGKEEEVYQGFLTASMTRPFTVYKTENSPEEWHYGPTPHSPPFYIVADKGYTFSDDAWLLNATPKDPRNEMIGVHGYNNSFPEMQAYFVAHGPAFKKGYVSPEDLVFNNIDVYPLLCHLLGIQARPNNGTLEHSLDFLVPTGHSVRSVSELDLWNASNSRFPLRKRLSICHYHGCDGNVAANR